MTWTNAPERSVECGVCHCHFMTRQPRKLFCDPCGIERRRKSVDAGKTAKRVSRPEGVQAAREANALPGLGMAGIFERPDYEWIVQFSIPYSLNASKNRRWSNNGESVVYITRGIRKFERDLIWEIKLAMGARKVRQRKTWVSFFVQKPNHKSDAINVVDTLCDAIKKAIDLDDRWFSIGMVDWEVVKGDGKIFIRIAQESGGDELSCGHCGRIMSLDNFGKSRGGPFGRQRSCLECSRVIQRFANRARA